MTDSSKTLIAALLDRSGSMSTSVDATALTFTHLFSTRGIALVNETNDAQSGGVVLTLTGMRTRFGHNNEHEIDSVYYARVSPAATGAQVYIVGKAVLDGSVPCTADQALPDKCTDVKVVPNLANVVNGDQEATVIHGVLTELGLQQTQS